MSSQNYSGTSVILNRVERYKPENFQIVKLGDRAWVSRTPDDVPQDMLAKETIKHHIRSSGSYMLSPFAFNWNQHSQIYSIVAIFKELSNSINLSSCRVDAIANDPGLAQLIKYFGSTNLPTAVEGVSNRVRNFLQKSITEDELYKGMNYIVETDFQEIKIYMIYTGLESQSDFDEWERFLKYVTELKRKYNRPLLPIRVSFTPLFSTLGTPTQYHGSKVSKSMKMAVPPIFNLKKISNRYDIGIRMSASVDSSDFGQLMDFLDRRGQPLIEYGSLCGFAPFNRAQVILSLNPREITKEEYAELPSKIRWEKDGKFWTCPETRKFTMNGVYDLMMDGSLYPDLPVTDFAKFIYSLDGKTVPELFMSWMVPSVRRLFEGRGQVVIARSESDEYVRTTSAGFKQFIARMNMSIGNLQVAHMKELLPVMTNGQTFEDIISDKSAFTVFPSQHVSSGETRSYTKYFAQYALNLVGLTELYCLSSRLAQCLHCGHCSTKEQVKHVSGKGRENEIGHEQIKRLDKIKRDDRTAQKILVEVYQEGGVYSAMEPGWFRNAVNRALLMAGHQLEWDLVESLIYEKYSHTRQLYRIKDDNFKSLVSGKSVYEVSFNSKFVFTPAHLEQLMGKVNQFVTKGWKITNLKLVPSDFILKNNLKYAITTFRFDSRKVNLDTVNLKLLEERISTFRSRDVKYKRQIRINKQVVRNQVVSFDKSKVLSLSCGTGRNQYETVLRVFSEVEDVHPLIFLAGFLSDKKAPKAYAGLLGTDISVEGFYTAPSTTSNIFDIGGAHEHGTECPKCGGQKALNVISGLPFGDAENEQDPDLMHKHGKVCAACWMTNAR